MTGGDSWHRPALLILPALLYALIVYPFIYHDVVGEPDLERIAMAVIYGASSGLNAAAGDHYDLTVSFGYYAGLYHLLPRSVLLDSSALITAINVLGFAFAVMAIGMLTLYASRLLGALAAFTIAIVFGLSPVFLELGTSGHPQLPGLALLLTGAWVLTFVTDTQVRRYARTGLAIGALALMTAALCVRADLALAFPFITLASREQEFSSVRDWLRASALRLAVLAPAFAIFYGIQTSFYQEQSGNKAYVANFFAAYYKPAAVPHGLEIFLLCTGIASVLALAVLLCSPARRQLRRNHVLAVTVLALPSLAFWLPLANPGRHLLVVTLAAIVLLALLLTEFAKPRYVIATALALPLANQVLAEAAHGEIVRHYQWTYPVLTQRRASHNVPLGAFPWDHAAREAGFVLLRDEGRAFARACSNHVLVLAEEPHYMLMSLVELDRSVRLSSVQDNDTRGVLAVGKRCTAYFVDKAAAFKQDAARQVLADTSYDGWPIYFQEARRNQYDRTSIPASRRYCIDAASDRSCANVTASR